MSTVTKLSHRAEHSSVFEATPTQTASMELRVAKSTWIPDIEEARRRVTSAYTVGMTPRLTQKIQAQVKTFEARGLLLTGAEVVVRDAAHVQVHALLPEAQWSRETRRLIWDAFDDLGTQNGISVDLRLGVSDGE